MYLVSKPDETMEIVFEGDEKDVVDNYAKWQGVEPDFFLGLCLQTTIRNCTDLFPKRLMMPGALDREIKKFGTRNCPRCHQTEAENKT